MDLTSVRDDLRNAAGFCLRHYDAYLRLGAWQTIERVILRCSNLNVDIVNHANALSDGQYHIPWGVVEAIGRRSLASKLETPLLVI